MKPKRLTEVIELLKQRLTELKTEKGKGYKRVNRAVYTTIFSVLLRVCLFLNRMEAKRT